MAEELKDVNKYKKECLKCKKEFIRDKLLTIVNKNIPISIKFCKNCSKLI